MKYVLLGCDPVGDAVLWEEGDFPSRSSLPVAISEELRRALLDWNDRMGVIVRTPERYSQAELGHARERLNDEGKHLAERIEAEQSGQVKVRYLKE